jgi:hypothetical protein
MILLKNIQFSCNIKAASSLKEFNFRKLPNTSDPIYKIDVSDERGSRHFFSMQLVDGQWKIQGPLVINWILDAEPLLGEAIEQQESQL